MKIDFFSTVFFGSSFALRMAGVMMISLGTIWLRTGLMPRWLSE
jgi:hypothetical protein